MASADFEHVLDSVLRRLREDLLAAHQGVAPATPTAQTNGTNGTMFPKFQSTEDDRGEVDSTSRRSSASDAMMNELEEEVANAAKNKTELLKGMSQREALSTSHRLRVRLGAISTSKLVSGQTLYDAVLALGLTRYSLDDMNELVDAVAEYINLEFPSMTSGSASETERVVDSFGLASPVWSWPVDEVARMNSTDDPKRTESKRKKKDQSVVPAQALMELFLDMDTTLPRKIFNPDLFKQFQSIKEILLAGETNRLVAELTFVRINDLAAPPEALHPVMYLEPFVAVLIIANGIMIGFQTSPQYEDWDGWIYLELTFIIFLLLEMGLRIRLLRCKNYWCGADRLWNFFDCFLALSGIADIAVQAFSHQNPDLPATSLLRFCRLIRLVRVVKVFRLKMMKDLRLMVKGLIAGIRTLTLAFTLLFAVVYVISGFATMTIGSSKSDHAAYFISIPTAMFTAFRCYTGECVTDEGYSITSKLGFDFGLPFIFGYVISYMLVTLGIFNVILAVYVDITMKAAKENEAITAEQHSRESVRIAQTVRELLKKFRAAYRKFHEKPVDDGVAQKNFDAVNLSTVYADDEVANEISVSKELFLLMVQDRSVQNLMDDLELPPDRATLFDSIDADGSGTLQLGELVQGLLKIRGELNKSDTVAALLATKALQNVVVEMRSKVDELSKSMQSIKMEVHRQRHKKTTRTFEEMEEKPRSQKSFAVEFPAPLAT